jgi:hypothetical protein
MLLATLVHKRVRRWLYDRDSERRAMALAETARERGLIREQDAVGRAQRLLERLLAPEQLRHYRRHHQVLVCTATARYCIAAGQRIEAARDGRDFSLCIQFAHPADSAWLPPEDLMIAQLLLIRSDEEGLWKRFAPPPYGEPAVEIIGGRYIFGPGELIAGRRDINEHRRFSTTVCVSGPTYFTENLEPIEPRTLPVER